MLSPIASVITAIYRIPAPHLPRFRRVKRAYSRICSIRVPGWLNFTADSLHRPGVITYGMIFGRLRLFLPSWRVTSVAVACSLMLVGGIAAPARAAVHVPSAHASQAAQVSLIRSDQEQAISVTQGTAQLNSALAAVPHIRHVSASVLSTAVSHLPDGKTMATLNQEAITAAKIAAQAPGYSPPLPVVGPPGAYPLRAISSLVIGRIDEGQDFCGSGPLFAVATGVILQVWGPWPNGVYILEHVTSGPAAGRYIYFAESISPTVWVGESVNSSTEVGHMYASATCIEIGWGSSTPSTPAAWGHYTEGVPTAEGYSMAAFLRSL